MAYQFTQLPPLSLYIHVPWCIRKCPYCDFNSHQAPEDIQEQQYVDALVRDLEQEIPSIWGRTINSIFIGGGTPSLFSAEAYDRLFSSIRSLVNLRADAEITLEANPGTFEQQRFADYRALGINRLSIGIQSFNDQALSALGRVHDSAQAIKAVETAHQVGFDNFNLDLMFGLPNQTEQTALQDIETAIQLNPTHISYYQLTLEPNTYFHQQPPKLPDEDHIIDWQLASKTKLAEAGFEQYEVSAFAQQNRQCEHNLNYWRFGDYIGIGAGAHGKISDAAARTITRRSKHKQPQKYIEAAGSADVIQVDEMIQPEDIGFEFMLNALRLNDGFNTALFSQHTGLPISHIQSTLELAQQQDLIKFDHFHIQVTEKGKQYLNTLIELFLPE
jgi:oxygen-independent coproporphyrinogen-3 oxidase